MLGIREKKGLNMVSKLLGMMIGRMMVPLTARRDFRGTTWGLAKMTLFWGVFTLIWLIKYAGRPG